MNKIQIKSFASGDLEGIDEQVNKFLVTIGFDNFKDIKTTSMSVCNHDGYIEHFNTATVIYIERI